MTSPDDLTGLFTSDDRDTDTPFRQGTIVTFNTLTGANTINVAGAVLTNVPLLNIGDTINLLPGDVVVLMKMKSAWAILGRVIIPGGASINASAISFASAFGSASGTGTGNVTATHVVKTSTTIAVPAWANTVAITAALTGQAIQTNNVADFLNSTVEFFIPSGGTVTGQANFAEANGLNLWASVSNTFSTTFSGITPGDTITIRAYFWVIGADWVAANSNSYGINALAAFTKT